MKERFTISIEPEVLQIARAEVEAGKASSVSAAVEEAIKARGRSQALHEAVRLSEAEHGPISEEAREWARRELKRTLGETSSSTQGP